MSDRITNANLEALTDAINRQTDSPEASYTRKKGGGLTANIGNYHLSWAYGGVKLERMMNEGGGITDVLSCGFTTKRELWNQMHAYLNGLQDSKKG